MLPVGLDQIIILFIVVLAVFLFARSRWRYDLVALFVLLLVALSGILTTDQVFAGFSHPAVMVVAAMFVISQALVNSGMIDLVIRRLGFFGNHPILQLFALLCLVTFLSAFINNVGALALVIPIAINLAKKSNVSPAIFLMPLAFASHLGGFLTLIGTPRNIIISTFRQDVVGESFKMFDFAYVGLGVASLGIIFLALLGWRLIPKRSSAPLFDPPVDEYTTEVMVPEGDKFLVEHLNKLRESVKHRVRVLTLIRGGKKIDNPSGLVEFEPGDTLLLKATPDILTELVEKNKLQIVGQKAIEQNVSGDEETIDLETVVGPNSQISGRSWQDVDWHHRYGVNLLAFARHGQSSREHLEQTALRPGDVLLLRGRRDSLASFVGFLKLLPLAERNLTFGRPLRASLALLVFIGAIVLASTGLLPIAVIFVATAVIMILLDLISLRQSYESIDWPILILLGSMITLGLALETSGAAATLSTFLLEASQFISPVIILTLVMISAIILSDFVNATASVVIMSPIAILLATSLGLSVDPFLMAVAIGGSCAFLTPLGHESNTLVMGPGGYRFGDYWRVGLPLEIIIVLVSLPLLLHFWPL